MRYYRNTALSDCQIQILMLNWEASEDCWTTKTHIYQFHKFKETVPYYWKHTIVIISENGTYKYIGNTIGNTPLVAPCINSVRQLADSLHQWGHAGDKNSTYWEIKSLLNKPLLPANPFV